MRLSKPRFEYTAIREFFADDFKYLPKRSIALKPLRVEASGILLIDSGEYTFRPCTGSLKVGISTASSAYSAAKRSKSAVL